MSYPWFLSADRWFAVCRGSLSAQRSRTPLRAGAFLADLGLDVRQQAAARDQLLHERRERLGRVLLTLGKVLDHTGGGVDPQPVAADSLVGGLRTDHDGQAH